MRRPLPLTLLVLALFAALPASAQERRQALLVGANTGWAMDQPLRYAQEDAHRVAEALEALGGFAKDDVTVLEDPTTEQLLAALDQAEAKARAAGGGLFVFYYSGHADAKRLHLKGKPLDLDALYQRLKAHPAKVKVGLFDACQAGSLLAAKGGRPVPTFSVKVEDDLEVQGTALLASSGADELSQEARALRGSFFTHHLVSGLLGAADVDHDGKVSLAEAYGYAASRTTLDTAGTTAGAQRPVFRYELKGRGDVVLTRLGHGSTLDFAADEGRCYVTDDAERHLVAEVPGGEATRLAVPPGAYLVKCPRDDGFRVAALTAGPGEAVRVKGLAFRDYPLSAGVLKGGSAGAPHDDEKRQGYKALRDGQATAAMDHFNAALAKDMRDQDAYRGKAQAYLALAQDAQARGEADDAERLRGAAVRTDPSLADDPQYRSFLPGTPVVPQVKKDFTQQNLEGAYPKRYQGLGLGLALSNPHGVLVLGVDAVVAEWLQVGLHLSPLMLGFGVSVRVVPREGTWSPYAALGGNLTLAGLGVIDGPDVTISTNGNVIARRDAYDRVAYAEGGVLFSTRHWQGEAGLALGVGVPRNAQPFFGVWPSLAVRFFF